MPSTSSLPEESKSFFNGFGKDEEEDYKKRPLFRTAAMPKDCFNSAFPEEIKNHIGSVKVVNAKQRWIKFNFRQILAAVKADNFLKDSFL